MLAKSVARSKAARIVILLGPQGAGKTAALLDLSGLAAPTAVDDRLWALVDGAKPVSFCSAQRLLPSRLTVRETIQLMAALHDVDQPAHSAPLLGSSALSASADQSIYTLPRQQSRMLNLVLALLSDPDVLLIDDVTRGLSLPAQRQLCRFILEEQQRRPRIILFATRDLHVAEALGGEVWLLDHGRVLQQWQPSELPTATFQSAAYDIDLKNPAAAHSLYAALHAQPNLVQDAQLLGAATVHVIVDRAANLLAVMQIAGRNLSDFRALPLEADFLLAHWLANEMPPSVATRESAVTAVFEPPNRTSVPHSNTRTRQQRYRGLRQLALAEWRAHFRRGWRAGNILFSSLLVLSVMQVMLQSFSLDRLTNWMPIGLLLSSSLILGFATESICRLTQVADSETLFRPARLFEAQSRLSLLALYDLTLIGRMSVFLGLAVGQFFVVLGHSIIPLMAWVIIIVYTGLEGYLLISGAIYWLLTAVNSLALAVLINHLVRRPGWNLWMGWALWPLVLVSSMIAWIDRPLTWLWPYGGLTVAIQQLPTAPTVALTAFGLALVGTITLCFLALRTFSRRSAVYSES